MKKYNVELMTSALCGATILVEADTEDQARELAIEKCSIDNFFIMKLHNDIEADYAEEVKDIINPSWSVSDD